MNEEYVKILLANMNTEIQTKAIEAISLKSQLQLANQTIETLQQQLQALVNTNEENYTSSEPEQAVPASAAKSKKRKIKE